MEKTDKRREEKSSSLFNIFRTFVVIGASTFGGGYAMVPVLERELINKRGWITMDEVMEYYTIAQVTPGIIAINVSTFVGYKKAGIAGALVATIGFLLPGVSLMILISIFLSRFASYPIVRHAFAGIRLGVSALILDTVRKLVAALCKKPANRLTLVASLVICAAAFVLFVVFSVSPAFIVAGAGLVGFLLFRTPVPLDGGAK